MKINIIGNHASQGFLLGRALESEGHHVNYFLSHPDSHFVTNPIEYIDIRKRYKFPFERLIRQKWHKLKYKADLEITIGTHHQYSGAEKQIIWWTGSDIRLHPQWINVNCPQFVATPDLLKMSSKFILLDILVDYDLFDKKNIEANFLRTNNSGYKYKIGHFPTNPALKRTDLFLDFVVNQLREGKNILLLINQTLADWQGFVDFKTKFPLNFKVLDTPRKRMPFVLASCDLVFGMARNDIGLIATTELEALSLGIPVASSINSELLHYDSLVDQTTTISFNSDGSIWFDLDKAINTKPKDYVKTYHSATAALATLKFARII